MKRRLNKKNFISYCILAGMLFFFMMSSAIPVQAEEAGGSDEEQSVSSGEAESEESEEDENESGDDGDKAELKEVEADTADEELVHTKKEEAGEAKDSKSSDDGDAKSSQKEEADDEDEEDDEDELDDDTMKSDAEIVVEESKPEAENAEEKQVTKLPMVDAPPIVPEGSDKDYNIFGVAGQYYVSVPKSMGFKKLANGDFETLQSSYYTVNSGLDRGYKLSVRVSGINDDETVQLANEAETVHRKVEVSTMACDIWQYRPDGTILTVNEADESGYGKELVLDGPGKFKAKCRLQQWGDDVLNAGTWSGSILFTVTCTPEPPEKDVSTDEGQEDTGQQEAKVPVQQPAAPAEHQAAEPSPDPVAEGDGQESDPPEEITAEGADVSETGTEFE